MHKAPIVLIGGIPGVGKTSISGYIAKSIGINIMLSGDYIREILRPFFPKDHVINCSVYDSWKNFGSNNEENLIRGFKEQGDIINKATMASIKRAKDNGEPIIIETLYFLPDQLKQVLDDVIPLYIYIDSIFLHRERLLEREKFTHFGSSGERLASNLENYRILMKESLKQSNLYGIKIFENKNYGETRENILKYIESFEN
jgi:mevalonate-3-phosphate-5-kinase